MLVHVQQPFAFDLRGIQYTVMPDEYFEDNDPIVRDHPNAGWVPVTATPRKFVESASAAPGELRTVKRPR